MEPASCVRFSFFSSSLHFWTWRKKKQSRLRRVSHSGERGSKVVLKKHLYAFMSICKIKVKYKWGCLCVWVREKNNKTIYVKRMGFFFSQSGNSELWCQQTHGINNHTPNSNMHIRWLRWKSGCIKKVQWKQTSRVSSPLKIDIFTHTWSAIYPWKTDLVQAAEFWRYCHRGPVMHKLATAM